jgi:SAM-dependent methyltransferase
MEQVKQAEWREQWSMFTDNESFLFRDWIYPLKLEDFKDKSVLECGCGGGQHTSFIAPYAREILAVDLNTIEIARKRNKKAKNIRYLEADISTMDLDRKFDIVFSIGVVHHTDAPDKTVANLIRHVKKGGMLILWVYSKEGNFLVENVVEPLRRIFFAKMKRNYLAKLSRVITLLLYLPVYTIYLLPFRRLPYYEYFTNFRKLSFYRNTLNVFDKLNAPQVEFISRERVEGWLNSNNFEDIHIRPYKGVSWTASGKRKN